MCSCAGEKPVNTTMVRRENKARTGRENMGDSPQAWQKNAIRQVRRILLPPGTNNNNFLVCYVRGDPMTLFPCLTGLSAWVAAGDVVFQFMDGFGLAADNPLHQVADRDDT